MKLLCLYLFMIVYLSYVSSRTLSIDGNDFISSEPKAELQMKLKQKNEDNIIWKKVESLSGHGIPKNQDGNNSGQEEKFNISKFLEREREEFEDKITVANMTETWVGNREPAETESLFAVNTSREDLIDFIGNHSNALEYTDSFESSDLLTIGNSSSSVFLDVEPTNISGLIILNFVDLKNEATIAEALIDNTTSIEPISTDSVVIEEGDAILFQDFSTFGFEFLIESETTKNSLLSEVLNSQNILITHDDNDELPTLFGDEAHSALEIANLNEDKGRDFNQSLNEAGLLPRSEIDDLASNLNLSDSNQNNEDEKIKAVCPEPGWCIFWFLAQDTCAKDEHCLGPRICCLSGCSKTCIDV